MGNGGFDPRAEQRWSGMNLYLSREGQTFGPYSIEQARAYLADGQFLANDHALFEGQGEWRTLGELLDSAEERSPAPTAASTEALPYQVRENAGPVENPTGESLENSSHAKSASVRKINRPKGKRQAQPVVAAKQKGLASKILSIVVVFLVTALVFGGIVTGFYFAMPSKVGPILGKIGIPVDKPIEDQPKTAKIGPIAKPSSPGEVKLDDDQAQRLRGSGLRILAIRGKKGLQVVSSMDEEMTIGDDDLGALEPLLEMIFSLDLTNSKITDHGLGQLTAMKNLEKLTLEGVKGITHEGIAKLKPLEKLSYLNLVRVEMNDALIDVLIGMPSLREVYLYEAGLSEEAIARLKNEKPKMFVNGG